MMNKSDGFAATQLVVAHVRGLIEQGQLRSGDRLPPERELALQLGVSRASLRAGLRSLAAMGVVQTRHGSGSFITSGRPVLGTDALSFLAALHGFTPAQMFEARLVLEVSVAGLAAERAISDQLVVISDEATGMFASLGDPQAFLLHDALFHRAVAQASGNPILSALVNMVSELFREQRRQTIGRASDLKESAEEHRAIYQAIRAHNPERARRMMNNHLQRAEHAQVIEEARSGEAAIAKSPEDTPEAAVKS
jgi:GntR family transcriptional regulator, transcriptional repressor for pyruvate dehydrogenase complex